MIGPNRFQRHRFLLSTSLALVFLASCAAPSAPPPSEKKVGGTGGRGQAVGVTGRAGDSSDQRSGDGATNSTASGAATAWPKIDTQKFLLGRIFVPLGIVSNNGANVIGQNGANVIGQNGANVIGQNGANIVSNNGGSVIGQNGASVIGQNGASVIGQNGANVIGQNGANIVSNNGGSVIGQNGANIVSNNGGSLGQRPLAYAILRVVDAAGKPKNGKNGQPLVGQADEWGQFLVPREEIDANCVIEVESPYIKGQLKAFVAKGAETPDKELEIDMVSTLATTYIQEKFVRGDQAVFERLTPDIEAEARQDVKEAIENQVDLLVGTTETTAVVSAVESLIAKNGDVQDVFKRIEKKLILVGVINDGFGGPAIDAPLRYVAGACKVEDGFLLFDRDQYRIFLVDREGILRDYFPTEKWPLPFTENSQEQPNVPSGMVVRDGALFVCDTLHHRIVRIQDGVPTVIVGTGTAGWTPDGTSAQDATISLPSGLAISPDGTLYFSEKGNRAVRRVRQDGTLETILGGPSSESFGLTLGWPRYEAFPPLGIAFDEKGDLLVAGHSERLIRLNISNMRIDDSVVLRKASDVCVAGERIFAIRETEIGQVGALYEMVNGEFDDLGPEEKQTRLWLKDSAFIIHSDGKLYYQTNSRVFQALDLATLATRDIAGFSSAEATHTLVGATSLLVGDDGSVYIADNKAYRLFKLERSGELRSLAGNGGLDITIKSRDASRSSMAHIGKLHWESPMSIVFISRDDRSLAPGSHIQRYLLDGRIETIAGLFREPSIPPYSGPANEIALDNPHGILKLADGRLLVFDPSGRIDAIDTSGNFVAFSDWPTDITYENATRVGDRIVFIQSDSGGVGLIEGGEAKIVVTRSEVNQVADDPDGTRNDTSCATIGPDGCVYFATRDRVFKKNLESGALGIVAGQDGVTFRGTTTDDSLGNITDIAFDTEGDLLVLELTQLKRLPKTSLILK